MSIRTRPAAILLAAGKSRRMGSCKQLLPLGGNTVIGCCLETLVSAGIGEIVVVVSPGAEDVSEEVSRYPVRVAVNPLPDGDMASSVQSGRDSLSPGTSGVVVALCDYPLVLPATVAHLLEQHERNSASILIPCHGGRRGHPLLVPYTVLGELSEGRTLRDLVRSDPSRVCSLAVDDPGVLLDMDTPEDYRRIAGIVSSDPWQRNDLFISS